MTRARLPNRRPSEVVRFDLDGVPYRGGISWFDEGQGAVAEVFLDAGRPGSGISTVSRDAAVLLSLALQHGVPVETLRAALTQGEDGRPAGPIGVLLDMAAEVAASTDGVGA